MPKEQVTLRYSYDSFFYFSEGRTLFELSPFSDRAPTFTEKEKDEEKETIDALFVILRRAGRLTKEQLFTGYLKLFEYKLSVSR